MNDKSRNLNYKLHKSHLFIGEVSGVDKDLKVWRHIVHLKAHECSCRKWQMRGIPCSHAISYICSRRELDLEDFVSPYYSVQMFKAAYATWVPGLPDKSIWKKVNIGFKLLPPILKRAAGRPRTRRYKGVEEGGSTKRRAKCKRCQGFGHLQKTCNEPVADPDAPPPAPPKPKRARKKPKKVHVTTAPEASKDGPAAPTKLRKKIKKVHVATDASKDGPAAPTKSRKKLKKWLLHLKHLKLSLLHLMLLKHLCECCSLMELLFFCFMKLLVLFYEIITLTIFLEKHPNVKYLHWTIKK
jgi:hypothetical protein